MSTTSSGRVDLKRLVNSILQLYLNLPVSALLTMKKKMTVYCLIELSTLSLSYPWNCLEFGSNDFTWVFFFQLFH